MTKYNDAVAEARRLVKRSEADQWRLAELTWEQVEAGKSQRQWAKDIGVAPSHVSALYRLWATYGVQHAEHRPPFAGAYSSIHTPGRTDEAEEHGSRYQAEARSAVRNLPPERKAEVARELLEDPEVADAVADVIEEKVAASPAATARVLQESERRRPAPPRHTPDRNAISAAASLTALEAVAARLREVVTDVVADVMDGQADPKLLADPIQSIEVDLKRLQIASSNDQDMDQALADLLDGGR